MADSSKYLKYWYASCHTLPPGSATPAEIVHYVYIYIYLYINFFLKDFISDTARVKKTNSIRTSCMYSGVCPSVTLLAFFIHWTQIYSALKTSKHTLLNYCLKPKSNYASADRLITAWMQSAPGVSSKLSKFTFSNLFSYFTLDLLQVEFLVQRSSFSNVLHIHEINKELRFFSNVTYFHYMRF